MYDNAAPRSLRNYGPARLLDHERESRSVHKSACRINGVPEVCIQATH